MGKGSPVWVCLADAWLSQASATHKWLGAGTGARGAAVGSWLSLPVPRMSPGRPRRTIPSLPLASLGAFAAGTMKRYGHEKFKLS